MEPLPDARDAALADDDIGDARVGTAQHCIHDRTDRAAIAANELGTSEGAGRVERRHTGRGAPRGRRLPAIMIARLTSEPAPDPNEVYKREIGVGQQQVLLVGCDRDDR